MAGPDGLESIRETLTYRITRCIARGGMGSVYEALQTGVEGFEKTVAIKTILGDVADDAEFRRLFVGEARLVACLVHENIVQVYHLGISQGAYFIAMEYVDGVDLETFIRGHLERGIPLPVELGAFITSRVCRGLEHAHTRTGPDGRSLGIVHRDVCPKNVMINFEGVVKVTDFGIAKARRLMEQDEDVLMGKFEYMSPEQARAEPTDARSDLFSLGVVAFELLTGRPLFRGKSPADVLDMVRHEPIREIGDVRAEIPSNLAGIVMRSLEREPARRFGSAGEMGYALEHYMYHDRFGPTNVTLGRYMRENFPRGSADGRASV